jgi:hypothetical protein
MNTLASRLPSISDVDRADDKLAGFISDLDAFASRAHEKYVSAGVSLEDAAFMVESGIAVEPSDAAASDPAVIARLLVFADEVIDEVELIEQRAIALRHALLVGYRETVIERSGRRRGA